MLDIRELREHRADVEARLKTRDPSIDLAPLFELDDARRRVISEVEELKAEKNRGSQEVAARKKAGKTADDLLGRLSEVSVRASKLDEDLRIVEQRIEDIVGRLPNLPHSSVPVGKKDEKVILRSFGVRREPAFTVRHHLEIGEEKGLLDFRRAAAIAGAKFPMYVGRGALLEFALIQFMISHHARRGYTPILPPFVANAESFYVSSQLPKFADDVYAIERDGLYLNPTAESLLVNLHRGETLTAEELPKKYVAYTPCFRREAGSYGEEERGLIRIHQFNKVELFKFTTPETSYAEQDLLIEDAESVLQALGMHYRVALLTTEDMAQQATKTVDLEVYLPGQGRYYEVSSCSNCEAFQARRGNIRYRPTPKDKPVFVHTLNGSGVATSRLMAAILENNQAEDGTIEVPAALRSLAGFDTL
ncbi:MAG: serine--tRNA ligase [Candidatus Bipolaricaulota bacterium]|nr:serine--tRNA ligase [Candidatus Bipolaricaulota bacterium]